MSIFDIVSGGINIVLITYEITTRFAERRQAFKEANCLNATYEMAKRLSRSLKDAEAEQAEDVASSIKSLTMNCMGRVRDEIDGPPERSQTKK